tara:strand:+ start:251 stop:2449 length:2199 start_codon:yes stop_codon:yes gene_type:complete
MALKKQMELFEPVEGAFNEGGLMDEGGTIDPASGNDVPIGSTQEEVRDDIPAQLSEGEFVLPADVVRYHGLEKIMELRDEAKAGLAKMEAMGQMGNSEEATLSDDVPFSMDDLEMEDDGIAQYQVGGFVQPPNPLQMQQQVGFTGISGYNPSQFQNYAPQYQQYTGQPLPTSLPTYTTPTQQVTPTYTPPNPLPTFGEMVTPTYVIYVNDQGYELSIPVDANGKPLIPVPAGYKKKSDIEEEEPPTSQPKPDQPSPDQTDDDGDSGEPSTPSGFQKSPELQKFESDLDKIKDTDAFKNVYEEFDKRTIFEKARDVVTGADKQYKDFADKLAKGSMQYPEGKERDAYFTEVAIAFEEQKEKGPGGIPVVTGTQRAEQIPDFVTGKSARTADQIKDIRETAITDITDTSPEAMQAAFEKEAGVRSAQVRQADVSAAEATKIEREERGIFDDDIKAKTTAAERATAGEFTGDLPTERKASTPIDAAEFDVESETEREARVEREERGDFTGGTGASYKGRDAASEKAQAEEFASDTSGESDRRNTKTRREQKQSNSDYNPYEDKTVDYTSNSGRTFNVSGIATDDKPGKGTTFASGYLTTDSTGKVTGAAIPGSKEYEDRSSDDSSGSEKSIVCTEMYRQTQLDDWAKAMKIWDVYQKKHLTTAHEIGYHWLFKPYVRGMQNSNVLTQLGAYLAQERTKHLKHVITKGRAKDSLVGNIWCKFIHPIVYVAGRIKNG